MSAVPAAVPRNAPCPCGSGRKHKLCCGMTRDEERAAARRVEALLAATALPELFPLLRPDCKKFDAWAARVLARGPSLLEDPPQRLLDEALAALSRGERERIVRWPRETMPLGWQALRRDADEEQLVTALLLAAVVVGLNERGPLDPEVVELLDEDDLADPAEALALAVESRDLWSAVEAQIADDALESLPDELDDEAYEVLWDATLALEAARLATGRHRKRLVRLVGYVRRRLPLPEHPRASAGLAAACAAFERDRAVRGRLAALLLADAL